jgi:hypothetical protein
MTETFVRATMPFLTVCFFAACLTWLARCLAEPAATTNLLVEITWGHRSAALKSFYVKLAGRELALADTKLAQVEATDVLQDGVARTSAGAGDVDGLSCTLQFAPKSIEPITNAHPIWKHLWKHGDAGAAQRLQADPAYRPDSRNLTVQLDEAGTRGFSLRVSGAPTYFGPVNLNFTSETAKGLIHVWVEFRSARRPPTLFVRRRHPEEKPLQSVTVNGQRWTGFDAVKEWVRIGAPQAARYDITAQY